MPRIDALFDALLKHGASDLHLAVGSPPMKRARGTLSPLAQAPIDGLEMEALLFEIVTPAQRRQIVEELDLDFAYAHSARARFRANPSTLALIAWTRS